MKIHNQSLLLPVQKESIGQQEKIEKQSDYHSTVLSEANLLGSLSIKGSTYICHSHSLCTPPSEMRKEGTQ